MNKLERLPVIEINSDIVVAGGGLAGVCAAIAAARAGVSVTLVTDRPVLGGNASSEVRLWALGASSHMGNNNRWSREGGVIDEILVENLYRNREGNPILFDALLLDKVLSEKNIRLLLNTSVLDVEMGNDDGIKCLKAFCSQNESLYRLTAPLFADATGDGIVGYLSGAPFCIGADEDADDKFRMPSDFGNCLGQTIFFYTRKTGKKVNYVPPSYALDNIDYIAHRENISSTKDGCAYWWLEYLGDNDPVFDTEKIKFELLKIVYGVWNHIKNSGEYPDAWDMTLEWAGFIPGKRESRRFEGDYMLTQEDIVRQNEFPDAVSYGGWAIDLHPSNGLYSSYPSCVQFHSKGVYQIPYRVMYSRSVGNLFLCGRIISATHVAAGSVRVMLTCAENAQVVGTAAAICKKERCLPKDVSIKKLQQRLLADGQFIPFVRYLDREDLSLSAEFSSGKMVDSELRENGEFVRLDHDIALLFPLKKGKDCSFSISAKSDADTVAVVELFKAEKRGNYTPDVLIGSRSAEVAASNGMPEALDFKFDVSLDEDEYVFLIFKKNDSLSLALSDRRLPGVLTLHHEVNEEVARAADQIGGEKYGFQSFPFYIPIRIPDDVMLAILFHSDMEFYSLGELKSGYARPFLSSNCICMERGSAFLRMKWLENVRIRKVVLTTDTDSDFAMETLQYEHPMSEMPNAIRSLELRDKKGKTLCCVKNNHQTRIVCEFAEVETDELTLNFGEDNPKLIVIYDINVYQ